MRIDIYLKTVLTAIAALLAYQAFRPLPVAAQPAAQDIYIEPGYTSIRKPDGTAQLTGKLVIDRSTGDIWGFPTLVDAPYPIDTTNTKPPVSRPIYLGRFDFTAMTGKP